MDHYEPKIKVKLSYTVKTRPDIMGRDADWMFVRCQPWKFKQWKHEEIVSAGNPFDNPNQSSMLNEVSIPSMSANTRLFYHYLKLHDFYLLDAEQYCIKEIEGKIKAYVEQECRNMGTLPPLMEYEFIKVNEL